MGSTFGQPQLSAQNYVLDYQCNLLNPRYRQLFQRLGPNAGAFPDQGKGQILNEMQECITNANPALLAEYIRLQHTLWCFYAGMLLCIILFIGLIFVYATVGGPLLVLCIIGGIVGTCVFSRKLNVAGHEWRGYVLSALQSKLQHWKAQYPAFTFTIIYPMEVWRRGNKGHSRLVAIWMYLRITQGLCQTGRNEPIYASSGMAPVQQTITTTQVVIQQPLQAQTVMVQGANGQMVPAHYAMVNGQQVLVVDQPPPQHYIQQQQQQYSQQQQQQQYNQQQYPVAQYQGQPQQQFTQPPFNPEGR